jgi:K(+)-stimulated pyrophosphate-energized sodium pump
MAVKSAWVNRQDAGDANMQELAGYIADGAMAFLKAEWKVLSIFAAFAAALLAYSGTIHEINGKEIHSSWIISIAFIIGAVFSAFAGYIGMNVATKANVRTTQAARTSLKQALKVSFTGGTVMGLGVAGLAVLGLGGLFIVFLSYFNVIGADGTVSVINMKTAIEVLTGFSLGAESIALFARVGGGIYTKAADVGADLVGKVEAGIPEDDVRNPATIADNVGDNVGDVAGMSADLFGSFAESTCAALVISCDTLVGTGSCNFYIANFFYPLLVIAFGIIVCLFVSILATHVMTVSTNDKIETTLKIQLIVSTLILIGIVYLTAALTYPGKFELRLQHKTIADRAPLHPFLCSLLGLVSGLIIAAFTEYVTSHAYSPVRELAETCKAGAGSNVTLGLALGYMSTVVPAILIAITAYFSNYLLGYYGVALAAIGMLVNLPLSLAIDGYGPISDNAGGIAEMSELGAEVRERTDALDAAGNTTAAIGKGFAIGSAALVSLALYGGFLHNAGLEFSSLISMTEPEIFAGLLLGAMLPYLFSAWTIKSVGKAAFGMVAEVRRQIKANPGILTGDTEPDYKACIAISTRASLIEMIAPGLLVPLLSFRSF